MEMAKCAICRKTAYPLESIEAIGNTYHKSCFKCSVCKTSLGSRNYKTYGGKIYCAEHFALFKTQPAPTQPPVVEPVEMDREPTEE